MLLTIAGKGKGGILKVPAAAPLLLFGALIERRAHQA